MTAKTPGPQKHSDTAQLEFLKSALLLPKHGDRTEESISHTMTRLAINSLRLSKPKTVKFHCRCEGEHLMSAKCVISYGSEKEFVAAKAGLRDSKNMLDSLYGISVEFVVNYNSEARVK